MDTDYHYSYTDNRRSRLLASPPILLFNEKRSCREPHKQILQLKKEEMNTRL